MRKEILIIRNTPRENPGIIETMLKEYSLDYQIIDYNHNPEVRPPENYSAMIVLGGPESANDRTAKMLSELELISKFIKSGVPYFGICLGLQTFVKAMGGNVLKCNTSEVGFRDREGEFFRIMLTEEGRKDRLFDNLPEVLTVFQLHGETVEISSKMELLAKGKFCRNQVVRLGQKAYGIQSHVELTTELLESWISEDSDLQKLNPGKLRADFESVITGYQETGRQLFKNFFTIAGLI